MKISAVVAVAILVCAVAPAAQTSAVPTSELISPALIDRAGWSMDWQIRLPVKTGETIDRMFVFDAYLYVLTDTNVLFCVNRDAGTVRFVTLLSSKTLPVCDPVYFENKLWFMMGNELIVVDPWAGTISERHNFAHIGNIYDCGLAVSDGYVYITGSDRRLHAFSRDGYWRAFSATADDDSAIVSLAALDDRVLFSTRAGSVISMAPTQAAKQWQFDATGSFFAELVVSDGLAYIGSHDAKLYALDVSTGRLAWPAPFHAGDRLRDAVVVGRQLVYLPAGRMGVYGVNKHTGQAAWQVPDGVAVLTETAAHSFVFSRPGLLNVMDNTTGRRLYSVNFSRVQRFASTMDEPKLYVADKAGRVAAVSVQ